MVSFLLPPPLGEGWGGGNRPLNVCSEHQAPLALIPTFSQREKE